MSHSIRVDLIADVSKFDAGMAAAKKTSSESMGFIASIFNTVKSYFAGMWDSVKSFFSNLGDKGGSAWASFKESASGAFDKVLSMLPGVGKAAKDTGDEMQAAEQKSDSWLSKLTAGLFAVVAAAAAAAAAVVAFTAKGLLIDSAFSKISVSTNVSAAELSKFEDAAKRSGMSIEQLGAGVTTFQGAMKEAAAGTGAKVFENLGVKVKDSKDQLLATDAVIVDFAKHVAAMSSEAEKYEAAAKSGFSVQFLEDLARAGKSAVGTTNDQAEAVTRLGKIFHEILPGGVSVWEQISTALSNKLTPALTTASISVLENKNRIVNAFKEIFAGGDLFDRIGNKIAGWANDMAGYFAKVVTGAANAVIGVMQYLGNLTGLGKPMKDAPSTGYVPPMSPLTSGKPEVVVSQADKDAIAKYELATKAIQKYAEGQQLVLKTGEALTQGQRMQLDLLDGLRDGTIKETDAQVGSRQAMIDTVLATEKQITSTRKAQQEADALAKKQEQNYASITSAIEAKIAQNELEIKYGTALTDGQKLAIKIEKDLETSKKSLTVAQIAETKAREARLALSERDLAQSKAEKQITDYVEEGAIARMASRNALEAEYEAYGKNSDALALLMVAARAQDEMQKELDKLRKEGLPISGETIKKLEAETAARTKAGQAVLGQSNALKYATQLADENKKFAAESIFDEKARAAALLKIDEDMWRDRISQAGAGTEAQKNLQQQYDIWISNQKLKPQIEEERKLWASIESTAHDTFISIFDSGKSAFDRLRDTLKNGLLELLYQMTIKKWILNIAGNVTSTGMSGVTQGVSALSGAGSLVGAAGNVYSAISGGMTVTGGLGTGFMGSLASGLQGAGVGSGLGSSLGLSIGNGIADVVGPQVAGALSSGLGTLAAAAPYLAAALAAYALYKHFDSGNTPHTGGASMASAAGSSTIRAESIGFNDTKVSDSANQMTAALASSVVSILDSTAMAFGKTAGYTAATAFADDSSKDGAWGALVISKLGSTVLDWNTTRSGGSWAPKEFADGEAGQAQYLAALSQGVRTALNQIGLPGWAQKMLDGVGAGATMDELAKVVDQINKTETALKMMGESLTGFSAMSDQAVTALINASGGIDALATNASAYYNAFYTDAEKSAGTIKAIEATLAAVGVAMPATQAQFRATVEAQQALGEAGAPAVAALFKVAGAFAQAVPAIEAAAGAATSATDAMNQRADLQKQFDQATMTSTQLRAKERLTIDASNLVLFDQITQLQTIKDTSDALKTSIDNLTAFKAGILSFRDSLTLGSLSTLNPMQKAAEAQRQYEDMLAKAKAGDVTAQAGIQGAATAYLTADQIIKASSDGYVNDALKVQADLMALADSAGAQISVDQLQLTALDNQVAGITTLNATVQGLRDDNAKLRQDNVQQRIDSAKLLAAVQDQTAAVVAATLQAAADNADQVNSGALKAGQARNYKLNLEGEAIPM